MKTFQLLFSIILLSEVLSIIDKRVINNKNSDNNEAPAKSLQALEGTTAHLPCKIVSDAREETPNIVLWFYNQSFTPFYTYNNMDESMSPSHWMDPQSDLASRSKFSTNPPSSRLSISNIQAKDAGRYKCRVDYHLQQTSFQLLDVSVIVPPNTPVIYYNNQLVKSNKIHVKEKQSLTLTCESKGGAPQPTLTWWQNSKLKDASYERIHGKVVNSLHIDQITREDLDTLYICQASNNNVSIPLSASVKIDILVPPLSVQILQTDQSLVVGVARTIECEVKGARPNHKISWWKNGKQLTSAQTQTSVDGNTIVSSTVILPQMSDAGATVVCRADTPGLTEIREHKWQLPVRYRPNVDIHLGGSLNSSNIREFDDVYFECRVKSNPSHRTVHWMHNGKRLQQDKNSGIIISGNSLAIQGIKRDFIGNYSCSAINDIGQGSSNTISLDIKYSPACYDGQQFVYEVAKMSTVHVSCHMDSNPKTDLSFKWTFNTTANTIGIPDSDVTISGTRSVVKYTPKNEMDFGTLICWGSNSVGPGQPPCVYHLLPIGPPDPPIECLASNVTYSTAKVSCVVKYDKNLPEVFGEVRLSETGEMIGKVAGIADRNTTFLDITGLTPGTTYTVTVQIRNKFGTSEPLHVPVVTMLEPIKQLAETKVKNEEDKNEILAMVLGGLVTTILLVIVILLVSFSYRRRLLEHSAATLSSTSARLLETHPEQKPSDMTQFSSYTINTKQSTTTFNSNLFVPSISNDIYGQIDDKSNESALNSLRRQKPYNVNKFQHETVGAAAGGSMSSQQLKYEQLPTSENNSTLRRNNLDFRENIGKPTKCYFNKTLEGSDIIKCPNEVVLSKESRI